MRKYGRPYYAEKARREGEKKENVAPTATKTQKKVLERARRKDTPIFAGETNVLQFTEPRKDQNRYPKEVHEKAEELIRSQEG